MYTVLVFSTALVCLSGFIHCDELPAVKPDEPVIAQSAPESPAVLIQSVNESDQIVQPDPVKSNSNATENAPLPVGQESSAVQLAPMIDKGVGPIGPVVVNKSEEVNVTLDSPKVEDNDTLKVVPNLGDNEHPELSERRINIPGLGDITPDSVRKILGAFCTDDSSCTVKDTVCLQMTCKCKEGYRLSSHKLESCIPLPKGLNDSCEMNSDCTVVVPASECINNKCNCPPSFVADSGACWETKGLGATCETTIQCSEVLGAGCLQGVCACPADHVPSPTSNKCLQRARGYQSVCTEDIQCTETMGDNARCNNKGCICKEDHHYNGSRCITDRKLGSSCEINEDCTVALSTEPGNQRACVNNNCTCATGFRVMKGEDHCEKNAADQIAISLSWMICIIIAKYFI